jgi:hypothetical protein
MTLQATSKRSGTLGVRATAIQSDGENTSQTKHAVRNKSGSGPMKSILKVAGSRAMSLMIGCKPNANSSVRAAQSKAINQGTQ